MRITVEEETKDFKEKTINKEGRETGFNKGKTRRKQQPPDS